MKKIKAWFKKLLKMFCANIKKLFVVNEQISIKILWTWICISLSLSILFYCLTNFKILNMETSLTAFIALTGALPTVYLWIVRERKKEKDQEIALSSLKKKDIELYQNKISELNKVYVDAITQFYNSESFMAGAYALNALVDDWLALAKEHPDDSEEHLIRVSQISSILFSKRTEMQHNIQFNHLIEKLFIKIAKTTAKYTLFKFNWLGYSFEKLHFGGADFNGADLSYAELNGADLRDAELNYAILIAADLSSVDLAGAKLNHADLSFSALTRANLRDAELNHAIISNSSFSNADLSISSLREMKIDIEGHLNSLIGDYDYNFSMTNCDLTNADLTNTDLTYADLRGATFSDTIISYNQLFEIKQITLNQIKGLLIYDDESKDNESITETIIEKLQPVIQDGESPISKTFLKALLKIKKH
ncbi:pentapeptide repeat-containing protein [Lactococcus lactis]|uniref:pentapeptide repeat-containing protein n=1 Tax=Lactococcus lactis TaxID=1358 RepID=UPI0022E47E77|nr:pentapeptide repeat-containing protein [Lactococcus lactis]